MEHKNYDTLVLSAGGSLGIMYAGALKVLQDIGVLQNIHRFVGSSVGAIVACCLSLSYTTEELLPYFCNLSLQKIKSTSDPMRLLFNCWNFFGMHSTAPIASLMKNYIRSKAELENVTFQQVYDLFGNELHITACNATTGQTDYFSKYSTPDLPVVRAVCMSISVPLLFQPLTENECLYIDGATFGHYCPTKFHGCEGKCVLTLELTSNSYTKRFCTYPIEGLRSFAIALARGVWKSATKSKILATDTIFLEFDLDPLSDSVDPATRRAMVHQGVYATTQFFKIS